jgi:predicted transglutaminase-like cysteine proteinase
LKTKKKHRIAGYLCAAFAAVTLVTGCGLAGQSAPSPPGTAPTPAVSVLKAFGAAATPEPATSDPFNDQWNAMLAHQQYWMSNTKDAAEYKNYLSQFDKYRGESLDQEATAVNFIVNSETTYTSDPALYNRTDYWAAPIETSMYRAGDCEDYAILQMYDLRYLGVAQSRLFIATVNAEGSTSNIDHAILLLNDAPAGQPAHFVVLNDATPVLSANNSIIRSNWNTTLDNGQTVTADYILFGMRNVNGYWQTALGQQVYNSGQQTASAAPKPVITAKLRLG